MDRRSPGVNMMKINSARLGEIEVDPSDIYTFVDGIFGFPDQKNFVEVEFLEGSPLKLLQSIEEPSLAFIIIDPYLFNPDYSFQVSRDDMLALNAREPDDVRISVLVTIPEDPYNMTANLQGPLILSKKNKLARQVVNNDSRYNTKHKVLANPPSATAAAI